MSQACVITLDLIYACHNSVKTRFYIMKNGVFAILKTDSHQEINFLMVYCFLKYASQSECYHE
jgi:hypothetical protein